MPIETLDRIFRPRTVAVVGASDNLVSVGYAALRNMLRGFSELSGGQVFPVNPKRDTVQGVRAYASLAAVAEAAGGAPDLVVVCTPSPTVPAIVKEAGELGTRGMVVISAGFREAGAEGLVLETKMLEVARQFPGMRIVGPNCLGVIVPGIGLDASFAATAPNAGRVAFISQSGALGTSVLDWASAKGIGLSHFVSVGNMADVQFADLIDYFGQDPSVSAILLYVESIRDARAFVSACRAFTRTKPIIAYKAGRFARSAAAAQSHTGAMMGADDVHDAAFRRCGIERVYSIDDLFDCAELLAHHSVPKRGRLAIVTNAGGPGVMASDALLSVDGQLADLSAGTIETLNGKLPPFWSHGNPVDVLGDAPAERYGEALKVVLGDENADAVLVILTPQSMTDPTACAQAVIDAVKETGSPKPVLTAWLGGRSVEQGRALLSASGLPTYPSPERAIRGFMHLVSYARNIVNLYETPLPAPPDVLFNADRGGRITDAILSHKGQLLSEVDAKTLLDAYSIPVARAARATSANEAARHAGKIGYPVAMKILSNDITHKSDVGGVKLNLADEASVREAFETMMTKVKALFPHADIDGVTVQPMVKMPDSIELILGTNKDPVFGSVVLLGIGGTTAEIMKDKVLGLPPLTEALARQMLRSLRSYPLLTGYRGKPAVDMDALVETIIRFSYMVADSPNLKEFDINPLLVGPTGVMALDARAITDSGPVNADVRYSHLAIRPYPAQFMDEVRLADGTHVTLRAIKSSDEPLWRDMLTRCSPETIRARYFQVIKEFTHEMAARHCFVDYDRELAIVAITNDAQGNGQMIGVTRLVADPDRTEAEFALFVEDAWQGHRIGSLLTGYGLQVAREWGLKKLTAQTMRENRRMTATLEEHGFTTREDQDEGMVFAEISLG